MANPSIEPYVYAIRVHMESQAMGGDYEFSPASLYRELDERKLFLMPNKNQVKHVIEIMMSSGEITRKTRGVYVKGRTDMYASKPREKTKGKRK